MGAWDCAACGCRAIASALAWCPQCLRDKEETMPKITRDGGATSAWEPGKPEAAAPAAMAGEHGPELVSPAPEPEPAAPGPEPETAPKRPPAPPRSAPRPASPAAGGAEPTAPQGT